MISFFSGRNGKWRIISFTSRRQCPSQTIGGNCFSHTLETAFSCFYSRWSHGWVSLLAISPKSLSCYLSQIFLAISPNFIFAVSPKSLPCYLSWAPFSPQDYSLLSFQIFFLMSLQNLLLNVSPKIILCCFSQILQI